MNLFIIDTAEKLKQKLDLIQNLIDIQVAHDLIKDKPSAGKKIAKKEDTVKKLPNPLDTNFLNLKIKMNYLDAASDEYKMIDQYIQAGKSHYNNLQMVDCFKIEREGEATVFNPDKLGNRKLLWHGSRFSNFVGILSQGLRIAPPEAPSTGYLFGKGVYFADIIAKSFPYACPYLSNGVGIYILAEVALGNTRELNRPDHDAAKLPPGKNSTHALGM
jgi:poly [ADP-ribose] polymerase